MGKIRHITKPFFALFLRQRQHEATYMILIKFINSELLEARASKLFFIDVPSMLYLCTGFPPFCLKTKIRTF